MLRTREAIVRLRFTLEIAALVLVTTGCVIPSDSVAGEPALPDQLEHKLASSGTADDHLAAASLYQKEAQRAQAESHKYQQAAAAIRPIEDPKGFRRSALLSAAQEQQKYANQMQQLYAAHQSKAETMMGKRQPQE